MNNMLNELAKEHSLIVRTSSHIQIRTGDNRYINIWPKGDWLRVQLPGMQKSWVYKDIKKLKFDIERHKIDENTDYAALKDLERLFIKANAKSGIFCDASIKGDKTKIAVIKMHDGNTDVHIRYSTSENINDAECQAIQLALSSFNPTTEIIYSDSKNAVDIMINHYPNIKWVKRENNIEADSLATLRNKNDSH